MGELTEELRSFLAERRYAVLATQPGIEPDSIELTSEQNVLTIRADR